MNIGTAFRFVREHKQMTQAAMCGRLNITQVHLSNIETGKANPSWGLLSVFNEQFGVDPYVLAWRMFGDLDALPTWALRESTAALQEKWKAGIIEHLGKVV